MPRRTPRHSNLTASCPSHAAAAPRPSHAVAAALRAARSFVARSSVALLALLLLLLAPRAAAVPSLRDDWHFFCAISKPTTAQLNKAQELAASGGVKGAIATLNYACLLELAEQDALQARLAKFQAAGGKGQAPVIDNRNSSAQLKHAAQMLAAASRKPDPKVLYYYGLALALIGDLRTVNVFDNLERDFPDSPFTGDSYLTLGEHYFERRDLEKAYREYGSALKKGRPITQLYTRYKMTWVQFAVAVDKKDQNTQRKAIGVLVKIKGKAKEDKEDKRSQHLAEMIQADVLDLLAMQGNLEDARRTLRALDAEDVYAALLERMAGSKLDAGDAKGAYSLLAMSLREGPKRPEALQIATTMVQLCAQANDVARVMENLRFMVPNFALGKSPWRAAQKEPLLTKASTQVEGLVYDFATGLDRQGRDTNNPAYLNGAQQLYQIHAKSFPKSAHALDVKSFFGQLLFVQKQYQRSAQVLLAVVKTAPKNKLSKDLFDILVTAAQTAVDADKTKYELPEAGTALVETPIPGVRKVYADALDAYAKAAPDNPNAPAMIFASTSVYYDFGYYDVAIKRYMEFIKRYPAHEFTKPAAVRVLVYYQKQNDAKGFVAARSELAQVPQLRAAPDLAPLFALKIDVNAQDGPTNKPHHGHGGKVADDDDAKPKGKKAKAKKPADDGDGETLDASDKGDKDEKSSDDE